MKYIGKVALDDMLSKANELVICGAGNDLNKLWALLDDNEVAYKVIAICDNDYGLQGKKFKEICIRDYESVVYDYPSADYLVYNRFSAEIAYSLMNQGITNIHILRINQ